LEWADCFFSSHVFFSICPAVWPRAIVMLPLKTYYSNIVEEYNHSAQKKIPLQSTYSTVLLHKSKVLEVGFTCLTKSFYRKFHCEGQEFWHCCKHYKELSSGIGLRKHFCKPCACSKLYSGHITHFSYWQNTKAAFKH
jgi:hypothetical protein